MNESKFITMKYNIIKNKYLNNMHGRLAYFLYIKCWYNDVTFRLVLILLHSALTVFGLKYLKLNLEHIYEMVLWAINELCIPAGLFQPVNYMLQ